MYLFAQIFRTFCIVSCWFFLAAYKGDYSQLGYLLWVVHYCSVETTKRTRDKIFLFYKIIDLYFPLHMVFKKYEEQRYVVKIGSVACPWDFWRLLYLFCKDLSETKRTKELKYFCFIKLVIYTLLFIWFLLNMVIIDTW